jgi:hypothetical protein
VFVLLAGCNAFWPRRTGLDRFNATKQRVDALVVVFLEFVEGAVDVSNGFDYGIVTVHVNLCCVNKGTRTIARAVSVLRFGACAMRAFHVPSTAGPALFGANSWGVKKC